MASAAAIGCQANASFSGTGWSSAIKPAWWDSIQRTGMSALPFAANSGQYFATGASRSSAPRSASMCAAVAVAPLVAE